MPSSEGTTSCWEHETFVRCGVERRCEPSCANGAYLPRDCPLDMHAAPANRHSPGAMISCSFPRCVCRQGYVRAYDWSCVAASTAKCVDESGTQTQFVWPPRHIDQTRYEYLESRREKQQQQQGNNYKQSGADNSNNYNNNKNNNNNKDSDNNEESRKRTTSSWQRNTDGHGVVDAHGMDTDTDMDDADLGAQQERSVRPVQSAAVRTTNNAAAALVMTIAVVVPTLL